MSFHRAIIDATGRERLARAYSSVQSEILLCLVQLRAHYQRPARGRRRARGTDRGHAGGRRGDAPRTSFAAHLAEAVDNLTKAWQQQTGEKVIV